MQLFEKLDPRLDPYALSNNALRIGEISQSLTRLAKENLAAGLTIIVLNVDMPHLVSGVLNGFKTVRAELKSLDVGCQLVIGDTGSVDPSTLRIMREANDGDIKFVCNLRYHFSRNNNDLSRDSQFKTILFLNNDVLIDQNPEAVIHAYETHLATGQVVSSALDFPDGRIQHRGVAFFRTREKFGLPYHLEYQTVSQHRSGTSHLVDAVTGAFLMIDSQLFFRVGGFDERYDAECQDIDLCLKVNRLGVGCRVVDAGPLVHLENATRPKGEENWHDRQRFVRRWSSYIETL